MKTNQISTPYNWTRVKFSDFINFQEGPGLMSFLFKESGYPFINIRCIENGNINKNACQFISMDIANNVYKHFQLEENDLIVSTSGTLGKKAFVKKTDLPLLLNTSIIRFKPKDTNKISLYFLNYLLEHHSFLYDLLSQSTGSAQINVGPSHLKKLYITIPKSIAEQKKIASILSKVDHAIDTTQKLVNKYESIRMGLMQNLLTKGIDEKGYLRSEKTHKFKNSLLGRIPLSWDLKPLGKIAEFKSGYAFKFEQLTESGHKIIRISNLHKPDFPFWHYEGAIKESWIAKSGDILFTWAGIATSIDCIKYEGENALLNQHIYNFIFKNDIIKQFTYKYLQSFLPKLRLEIEGGAGQLHLTKDKIQAINIPIMDESEMVLINERFSKMDELIDNTNKELLKLNFLKKGLMQDLLSGKVKTNNNFKK